MKEGDLFTKLSFLVMGLSNLVRKQIIKGLIFLGMEIGFFFYLFVMGITAISHFDDLGENTQGMVLDEAKGIYVKSAGDNSMLLLLAAITAVFIIVAFVLMWRASIISGFKAQKLKEDGKYIPNFFDDINKSISKECIYIVEKDNELVGFGVIEKGIIREDLQSIGMFVRGEFRRIGIGTNILKKLKIIVKSRKKKAISGCWYYNHNSLKTQLKSGNYCESRLLRVKF